MGVDESLKKLTSNEQKKLEAWKAREGWTKEKSFNGLFDLGHHMPRDLVAPNVKGTWGGGNGKYVCVMCGKVTTVTNLCRQCPEMPATEETVRPLYCYYHDTVHEMEKDGKRVPSTHIAIEMVKVA